MERIFITAASGNIGAMLRHELDTRGLSYSAASRRADEEAFVQCDFTDISALCQNLEGHTVLFLLLPDHPDNLSWTKNLIKAAREVGVRHIVRSSGIGAATDAPYAILRHLGEIEAAVRASGIQWTVLRPNSFMENFATYELGMIQSGTLYTSRAAGRISFVSTADIARVAAAICERPEEHHEQIYTLTGPGAHTMEECIQVINATAGIDCKCVAVSDEDVGGSLSQAGMPGWNIDMLLSLYRADREGMTATVTDSVRKVSGSAPLPFDRFVKDRVELWRSS